jgi:general secretion pathway protein D
VVFNFDNADIEVVLQAASEIAGFNYVIAPAARGRKVTVQTPQRLASDDIFNVLLTILDVNGLAAVRSGNLYRIIPREGSPQTAVRTSVGREVDPSVPGDQVLTQIVPLQYISATDAMNLLRPFVPAAGSIAAHPQTGMLIITDVAANVRRLLDVISLADMQVAMQELKIIQLKHADAQEMAQLLTQIFSGQRSRGSAPVVVPAAAPAPPAVPGAPRPPTPPPTPGAVTAGDIGERPPLVVAERRSNSLIVHASRPEQETVRRLVEQLDVDIYGGQRVFIYFAENAKARDLANTLDAIFGKGAGASITGTQQGPDTSAGVKSGAPAYTPPPPRPTTPTSATSRPPGSTVSVGEEGGVTGEVRFIADEVTNAIIVTTYPRNWKDILETIKKLDKMPRQVLIEVLAAEVTLADDMKLGVEWAIRTGKFDIISSQSNVVVPAPARDFLRTGLQLFNPGLTTFAFVTDRFLGALNALALDNKLNVLSNPSVMTAENKKAVINVSRSVPILTTQQVPVGSTTVGNVNNTAIVGTQTVEYRDAGVVLTVTPRIGEEGTVALDVKQEVNDVGDPVPPTNSPEFKKREAETSVVLLNNQTLVLGGLIQTRKATIHTGIPFLGRIPVIGYLFRFTQERVEKTELILLITPRVVGTALEAARISDQMRRITPGIEDTFQNAPRPPSTTPPPLVVPNPSGQPPPDQPSVPPTPR